MNLRNRIDEQVVMVKERLALRENKLEAELKEFSELSLSLEETPAPESIPVNEVEKTKRMLALAEHVLVMRERKLKGIHEFYQKEIEEIINSTKKIEDEIADQKETINDLSEKAKVNRTAATRRFSEMVRGAPLHLVTAMSSSSRKSAAPNGNEKNKENQMNVRSGVDVPSSQEQLIEMKEIIEEFSREIESYTAHLTRYEEVANLEIKILGAIKAWHTFHKNDEEEFERQQAEGYPIDIKSKASALLEDILADAKKLLAIKKSLVADKLNILPKLDFQALETRLIVIKNIIAEQKVQATLKETRNFSAQYGELMAESEKTEINMKQLFSIYNKNNYSDTNVDKLFDDCKVQVGEIVKLNNEFTKRKKTSQEKTKSAVDVPLPEKKSPSFSVIRLHQPAPSSVVPQNISPPTSPVFNNRN